MLPLHPVTVHFPLALLLTSSLFTLLALRFKAGNWDSSAYHCLLIGCLGGLVALLTGTIDAVRQIVGPDATHTGGVVGWVNTHAFVSLAALVLYGRALLLRRRWKGLPHDTSARRTYLWLHAAGAMLLTVGGWLGGQLVYGFGLGVSG